MCFVEQTYPDPNEKQRPRQQPDPQDNRGQLRRNQSPNLHPKKDYQSLEEMRGYAPQNDTIPRETHLPKFQNVRKVSSHLHLLPTEDFMITSSRRVFMGVDRRVVLCRPTLQLPPPRPTRLQLIKLLTGLGFGHVDFPIATIAKELVGKPYLREARMSDAPNAFTCSTLVRHLYAMRGIWIPRFVEQ